MKLHQLVGALFCGLMAPEIPWRGLFQAVYGGVKTPADNAGGAGCPGSSAGVSSSALAPGTLPFPLQCAWILPRDLWVGPWVSNDSSHWAESKINNFSLAAFQLNVHMQRVLSQALGHRLGQ